jgi:hypothetical protein
MKHRLSTTILTTTILAASLLFTHADDRAATEKAKEASADAKEEILDAPHNAGRATRTGWCKTKAFSSEDISVYHEGARTTLAALAREIGGMRAGATSAPAYFRTRLLALDEQHGILTQLLAQLSREEIKERSSMQRRDFDLCLGDLERAVDQAESGADAWPRTPLK